MFIVTSEVGAFNNDHVMFYFVSLRERVVAALMAEKDAGGPFQLFLER